MTKKKMGNERKLSQFSSIKPQVEESASESLEAAAGTEPEVESAPAPSSTQPKEKLVTVNIKIARSQHHWLNETARTIRENNLEPVPPGERVFPQHLIGMAIALLQSSDVDWSQVQNVEDLRRQLNL